MLTRRAVLASAAALPVAAYAGAADGFEARVADLEKKNGGRIGIVAYDTGAKKRIAYRADERFLMCSTFKLLLVAATLKRIDEGKEDPRRHVTYSQADLLGWAPVTKLHVAEGMDVIDVARAAIDHSDNTAANLLYAPLGGPAALQHFARADLSDWVSSIDRTEPTLNTPDGDKDTTMPSAMLGNLRNILVEDVLKPQSRIQLMDWMIGNTTGATGLRAGLPSDWQCGDKTGNGSGAHNDIAFAIPSGRQRIILISAFTFGCGTPDDDKGTLADIGRLVAQEFA